MLVQECSKTALNKTRKALKNHKNGLCSLAFASVAGVAGFFVQQAASMSDLTAVFASAAVTTVSAVIATRQFQKWWRDYGQPVKDFLKLHRYGAYGSGLMLLAGVAGYVALQFAQNNQAAAMLASAMASASFGHQSFRQFRTWWKNQANFIKEQGSGYLIGQISSRSALLAFGFLGVAYYGLQHDHDNLALKSGLLAGGLLALSVGSLWKGDDLLKMLRAMEVVYRAPAGFYGSRIHLVPRNIEFLKPLSDKEKQFKQAATDFSKARFIPEDHRYSRVMASITVGRKLASYAILAAIALGASQTIDLEKYLSYFESNQAEDIVLLAPEND